MRFFLTLGFVSVCLAGCNNEGLSSSSGRSDVGAPDAASDAAPDAAMVACNSLATQAECSARSDCGSFICPGCSPNDPLFACIDANQTRPHSCPKIACPEPCSQHTSEVGCAADSSCFAIYNDGQTCGCSAPGCCMLFARCAPRPATCATVNDCKTAPPCGPGLQSVYEGACATGCVHSQDCPPH